MFGAPVLSAVVVTYVKPNIGEKITTDPRINDRIRTPQVRLINYTGQQVGVVDIEAALAMADEIGLDLVEIAAEANPPVCKIMDFGKYKYEVAQK
ncbi:MAG: translation initiation factor IF-3, partial [Actinobacteria bacterium]|nr:translation initiation factor IF-3 [Actinomycetota bacterium]